MKVAEKEFQPSGPRERNVSGSTQTTFGNSEGDPDMTSTRRTALWAGIWFAITFLASIPAAALYGGFGHVLKNPQYVLGGANTRIEWGAFLELILLIANIATAVVLFPVLKWHWEAGALGYVTARVMESAFIMVGILSLLAVLTIGNEAGPGTANTLIAVHDWSFTLGRASSSASAMDFCLAP